MSDYWNYVFKYINQVNHIYFAVGCAMPQYQFSDDAKSDYRFNITEKNNQQYPCFMNKFVGKKMIVLIDTDLEFTCKNNNVDTDRELVIEQYFARINQPLQRIVHNEILRVLGNNEVIVFAHKSKFYYEEDPYMPKHNVEKFREVFAKFIHLIEHCIEYNKKIIVQDYTGRDLTHIYLRFLDTYGNTILNNIIFDVTQEYGGCYIELKPSHVNMDKNGNFIQEKYSKLVDFVNSERYKDIYKSRLSIVNYPLSWSIFKLNEDENYSEINFENYILLFTIYDCIYDDKYKKESLIILVKAMLEDIIKSRGGDLSRIDEIMSKITKKQEFKKELELLL